MSRLVCFDIGNVLVRLRDTAVEGSLIDEYSRLTRLYGLGRLTRSAFLSALKRLFQWQYDLSDIESWFVHHRIEGPQPGAQELLAHLHKKSATIALLSNTNASHWAHLKRLECIPLSCLRVLSFEQQCAKPEVEIYRRLEMLSGCRGAEIIFFDDLKANIQAAACMGWLACQITPVNAADQMRAFLHEHGVL
ncbi:Haloacid dehalogenase-like hydrolase [Pseudomonas cedrina]|uniref:Haloacid dehalogenase n=2 Tax=Pseudomonas cedrina TaxID=651740 RepID=A0A1V2JZK1_PSECE|nr:HAD-IA family hydrolase [Pseudomonas cedrina]ONH50883.1 hypothetical protein BLL36_23510 [Pseudomonas cedrina subsp. cedrina]SDS61876.1 Haloacid dehalogenase-like hydrolase [Pseudomonas cedrina]